jgi:hypothetical protein
LTVTEPVAGPASGPEQRLPQTGEAAFADPVKLIF